MEITDASFFKDIFEILDQLRETLDVKAHIFFLLHSEYFPEVLSTFSLYLYHCFLFFFNVGSGFYCIYPCHFFNYQELKTTQERMISFMFKWCVYFFFHLASAKLFLIE